MTEKNKYKYRVKFKTKDGKQVSFPAQKTNSDARRIKQKQSK